MKRATLAAVAVLLAGCVTSRQPPKQYDFGDVIVPRAASRTFAAKLTVRDVTTPSWLRTRDMFYRLDYEVPSHPQRYAMSEWIAGPGALLTLRLRQSVAAANAGFTLPASNDSEGYVLQAALEEFTQAFLEPKKSECIVQLRVSLLRSGDHVMAQHVFRIERPAPTPDANGGATCLAAAVDLEAEQIVAWLSDNLG